MSEFLLEARNINKSFSGVQVLKDVNFGLKRGEVHALMGENGAGKSTLIKILTGAYTKDSGEIFVDGKPVTINNRQDSMDAGISCIYQELSVIDMLTVQQNICLAQEKTKGMFLAQEEMNQEVQELIDRYNFEFKATDLVGSLSVAKKQTVEILKALSYNADIIIMDEPTSSLTVAESEVLFGIIDRLKADGKSIVYISHRLDEVYQISDRMTILRNGENAGVLEHEEIDPIHVITAMIGHQLVDEEKVVHEVKEGAQTLDVSGLCVGGLLRNVSFTAHGGQILGIGGLVGAGRTELLECIFGLRKYDEGSIKLNGKELPPGNLNRIKEGIGLVPEDRRSEGLVQCLSIAKNVILASLDQVKTAFVINDRKASKRGEECVETYDVRPRIPQLLAQNMSGGNQQKVVIGKWLVREGAKLLLIDEPTVGIDIGAKSQIYSVLDDLAKQGVIVVVVSSDQEELLRISDRILIMYRGRIFKDFTDVKSITQEDLIAASSGLTKEEAAEAEAEAKEEAAKEEVLA